VILAAKLTLLVPPVRCTPALDPRPTTTPRPAVSVSAVARRADRERRPAPSARQQIQDDAGQQPLAHTFSGRMDKLTRRWDALCVTPACHTQPRPGRHPPGLSFVGRDNTQFLPWCGRRGFAADDDWDQFRGETSEFGGSRPPFTYNHLQPAAWRRHIAKVVGIDVVADLFVGLPFRS